MTAQRCLIYIGLVAEAQMANEGTCQDTGLTQRSWAELLVVGKASSNFQLLKRRGRVIGWPRSITSKGVAHLGGPVFDSCAELLQTFNHRTPKERAELKRKLPHAISRRPLERSGIEQEKSSQKGISKSFL